MIDTATKATLNRFESDINTVLAEYDLIRANDTRLYADTLRKREDIRRTVEFIESKDLPSRVRGSSTITIRGANKITVINGVNPCYVSELTKRYSANQTEFSSDFANCGTLADLEASRQLQLKRLDNRAELLASDTMLRLTIARKQGKVPQIIGEQK